MRSRKDGDRGRWGEGTALWGTRGSSAPSASRSLLEPCLGNAGDARYGPRAGLPRGPELGIKLSGVICLKREEAGEPHGRLSPGYGSSMWAGAERFTNPNLAQGVLEVGEVETGLTSPFGVLLPSPAGLAASITEKP